MSNVGDYRTDGVHTVLGGRGPRCRWAVSVPGQISGLHCSLCTGTIEKALGRLPGVHKVAVSLTHEQALVEFDPAVITPQDLLRTLKGHRLLGVRPAQDPPL